MKDRPPPSTTVLVNGPPTPPQDQSETETNAVSTKQPFTEEDAQKLLEVGGDIENIPPERRFEAWIQYSMDDSVRRCLPRFVLWI